QCSDLAVQNQALITGLINGIAKDSSVNEPARKIASLDSEITLDLKDEKFSLLKQPLDADCSCYSCKEFTGAYIYHLVKCKEIEATILLAM
ncbi:MAG: hypothetical protein MHPSP_000031, partial [Paramarteilia canceri]